MSDRKIKVPAGMLDAAMGHIVGYSDAASGSQYEHEIALRLEAALLWQRENAPVPNEEQAGELYDAIDAKDCPVMPSRWLVQCATEWVRRMYDVPEPEFEQKEVFFNKPGDYYVHVPANGGAPEVGPIEAYRRGQQDRK